MKVAATTLSIVRYSVSFLYILLFVYAALNKILDFENFQVQLGQSPLLGSFGGWMSYMVPLSEFAIVFLLIIPRLRLLGLYCSLALMVMFTAYIYMILNYASFIPCSCGGILEKLSWGEHLVFNLVFVVLAVAGILIENWSFANTLYLTGRIVLLCTASVAFIAALHFRSEDTITHHNNFIRRFPADPKKLADTDLHYNSFYWAGTDGFHVYLGNSTDPLLLTVLDSTLKQHDRFRIQLDQYALPFQSAHLWVDGDNLYLVDGGIPAVFKGTLKEHSARFLWKGSLRFSYFDFIDSLTLVTKTINERDGSSCLGKVYFGPNPTEIIFPGLLTKQVDGNFDVDGTFQYDRTAGNFAYVYRYRNGIIHAGGTLKLKNLFRTIDTVTHAQVKVAYVTSRGEKKLAAPPLVVNKGCAVDGNLLYVNSDLQGKYEPGVMWKQASVIDVYDLKDGSYLSSFYIHNVDGKKIRSFCVHKGVFFAFIGSRLVKYRVSQEVKKFYNAISA